MNSSKEEIVFLTPEESKLKRALKNGLKRILMVVINPFATYEEIGIEPEFFGPSILILLSLLFSFLDKYSSFISAYYTRTSLMSITKPSTSTLMGYFIVNYVSNQTINLSEIKTAPSLTILMKAADSILMLALFGLAMRLVPLYLVSFLLASVLKGDTRGMLPGICYTLSPLVLQQGINIVLKKMYLSSLKGIIVVLPKDISPARDARLISSAINLYLTLQGSYVQLVSLVNWFFILWQLVLLIALFIGICKFGVVKSIALTIATYVLVSIALMPIYKAIMGF